MFNYNFDNFKEWGFWYDVEIFRKCEIRIVWEFYVNVVFGDDFLNDCWIIFVDEVFKIECLGEGSFMVDNFMRWKSGLFCKYCKDDVNRLCWVCVCYLCGGWQDFDKQFMCDECDMVFYIYCLNLFFSSVFSEDEWYCFECWNDVSEVVLVGEWLRESKKKVKMVLVILFLQWDWGKGMVCVGCIKECIIVLFNYYGLILGIFVGIMWWF